QPIGCAFKEIYADISQRTSLIILKSENLGAGAVIAVIKVEEILPLKGVVQVKIVADGSLEVRISAVVIVLVQEIAERIQAFVTRPLDPSAVVETEAVVLIDAVHQEKSGKQIEFLHPVDLIHRQGDPFPVGVFASETGLQAPLLPIPGKVQVPGIDLFVVKKIIGKVGIEAPVLVEVIDPAFRINNGSLQPSLKVCAAPGSGVIQLGSCNVDVLKCIGGKTLGAGVNARHSEIISGHLLLPVLLISGIV